MLRRVCIRTGAGTATGETSSAHRQNLRPHCRGRYRKAAAARVGDADGAAVKNDTRY